MIRKEKWNKLRKSQPPYSKMLAKIAEEELYWLKSKSKDLSKQQAKRFQRLHEGLLKHGVIDNIKSTATLVEDLVELLKIS